MAVVHGKAQGKQLLVGSLAALPIHLSPHHTGHAQSTVQGLILKMALGDWLRLWHAGGIAGYFFWSTCWRSIGLITSKSTQNPLYITEISQHAYVHICHTRCLGLHRRFAFHLLHDQDCYRVGSKHHGLWESTVDGSSYRVSGCPNSDVHRQDHLRGSCFPLT